MGSGNNDDHIHGIIRFLQAHPHLKERQWRIMTMKNFPQQGNGYDCGLFVCAAALCIMTKQIMNFSQAHMENFRLQLAHILIKDSTLLDHTTALNKEGEREKRGRQEAEANQTSSSTTTTPETNIPKNTHITDSSPKPATRQTRKTKRKRHTGPKTGQKKDTPIEQPTKPPQINKRKIQQTKKQTVQSSIKKLKPASMGKQTKRQPKKRLNKIERFHRNRKQILQQQETMRKYLKKGATKPPLPPPCPPSPPPQVDGEEEKRTSENYGRHRQRRQKCRTN